MDTGKKSVLEEYDLLGDLSKRSRRTLTDGMVDFIGGTLSDIRNTQEVTEACNAMFALFPLLSVVSEL